jgi:hypothetical protein
VISRRTPRFKKAFEALPSDVQELARAAFRQFLADPAHPSLRFKQVHTSAPIYAARVGIHYRALAVREGDTLLWFWIGSHSDYDNLLKRL